MDNHKHVSKYPVASWAAAMGSAANFKNCAYKDMNKTNTSHLGLMKCCSTGAVGETKRTNELESMLAKLYSEKV